MPTYTITDPTSKKTVTLTGESPPTEAELTEIFSKVNTTPAAPAQPKAEKPGMIQRAAKAFPEMAQGAVEKVNETINIPALRALANMGVPFAQEQIKAFEEDQRTRQPAQGAERFGANLADAGMMMTPTPLGKTAIASKLGGFGRMAMQSAQGAAQHQAQNYGKTGEVRPGQFAGETALGTAVPAALMGVIKGAKNYIAPGLLALLTRANKTIMGKQNKPTLAGYRQALDEGLMPIVKGGYGEAAERGGALQGARDATRGDLLTLENVKNNLFGDIKTAEREILSRNSGSGGLLPKEKADAIAQLAEFKKAAIDAGANKGGFAPGKESVEFRKMVDSKSKFVEGKTPAGQDLAAQELRKATENQLANRMKGKPSEAAYLANKKKMAELAPVLEAFEDKAKSNYSIWADAMGLGTSLGAGAMTHNPLLSAIPAAMMTARRFPQAAPLIYEAARGAGSKPSRLTGTALLNLARSYGFSPNTVEQ